MLETVYLKQLIYINIIWSGGCRYAQILRKRTTFGVFWAVSAMGRVVPSRTSLGCVQIPSDVTLEDEGPPFAEQMGIDIQMTKAAPEHTQTQSCRVANTIILYQV